DVRRRVRKKIDEISRRLEDLNPEPVTAVEKRLKGRFSHIPQQRVGDYRIWFEDVKEDEVLLLSFVGHKEEAEERLG
ncbi:MAG: hypothetical protein SVS85_03060, partial [Candidatus Nanohaloarchaea archaeon]|nr:hypothetical protein [Candidatus Nanohaloarchaea archaeon]